jgi:hypothetical protein
MQPEPNRDFPVVEFRRYAIRDGERERFARYFESYFPEAFQQLGAMALGQFLERDNAAWFTWLRGFRDLDARASVNSAFYYGPLWKEHRARMNDLLVDSDNVLLLRALEPARGIPVLPAVDVVSEASADRGIVAAQIFAVAPGRVDELAREAEETFAGYRKTGVREAGVLVTLDVANNFPQLPVRTDGPYLVWFGIVPDDATLERRFKPLAERAAESLRGQLRGLPELVLLDPTARSRLRWLSEPHQAPQRR